MLKTARSIIGKNVRLIRKELNLSLLNFSILTDLSKATIVNIESGKTGYNLNLLDKIVNFTKFSLSDLTNANFSIKGDLRDKLSSIYKKNDQFHNILCEKPDISYAIERKILTSDFLDEPKEIRQIRDQLEVYNWHYRGSSISNALKRMINKVNIQPHPTKKGTLVYSKK